MSLFFFPLVASGVRLGCLFDVFSSFLEVGLYYINLPLRTAFAGRLNLLKEVNLCINLGIRKTICSIATSLKGYFP